MGPREKPQIAGGAERPGARDRDRDSDDTRGNDKSAADERAPRGSERPPSTADSDSEAVLKLRQRLEELRKWHTELVASGQIDMAVRVMELIREERARLDSMMEEPSGDKRESDRPSARDRQPPPSQRDAVGREEALLDQIDAMQKELERLRDELERYRDERKDDGASSQNR
jgi:hypothetical protein